VSGTGAGWRQGDGGEEGRGDDQHPAPPPRATNRGVDNGVQDDTPRIREGFFFYFILFYLKLVVTAPLPARRGVLLSRTPSHSREGK
jgi:hypothetical protein